MIDFLFEYGLFLSKAITFLIVFILCTLSIAVLMMKGKKKGDDGELKIIKLNEKYDKMKDQFDAILLDSAEQKKRKKDKKSEEKKAAEAKKKQSDTTKEETKKARLFVIDFDGDIKASQVDNLKEEVSAVLTQATENDEVLVKVNSPGGMVNTYGLAASEIKRIKNKKIKLTISVDKVAASGGYLIACIADTILAAPFAIIGSIGVVAQIPNFNKLLKKQNIDFEVLTAGKYKRTLTLFGENTKEGREKFMEDLNTTHDLFKDFVKDNRSQIDIDQVATGEFWYGENAVALKLVDQLKTSEDYIQEQADTKDIFLIKYETKQKIGKKIGALFSRADQFFSQQNQFG